jgi:PAS domain S-box-containing protein
VSVARLLIVGILAVLASAGDDGPQVLVLNSYHPAYGWTDEQTRGILDALAQGGVTTPQVAIEYLDAKRFPELPHGDDVARLLGSKYRISSLRCVVVTDNAALTFVRARRAALFPNVPIVFCGINGWSEAMLAGEHGITGIAELVDIAGTVALIRRLHPATRRLAVVYDQTITGRLLRADFATAWEELGRPLGLLELTDLTFAELQERIRNLTTDTVVLVLSHATDRLHHVIEQSEEAGLIAACSPVPVYAVHEARLGHGIVGGSLLSGRDHGAHAGAMAAAILAGADPSTMAVDRTRTARAQFDARALERWGIPREQLPPDAVVLFEPASLWRDYRTQVIAAGTTAVLLIAIIAALVASMLSRRRTLTRLAASEASLRGAATQWQGTFDAVHDALWVLDNEHRIVRSNRAADTLFGRNGTAVVGLHCWDIAHDGQGQAATCPVRKARRTLRRETTEVRIGDRLYEVTADPILDARGAFAGCVHLVADITEIRRLEEQQRHIQKMNAIGQLAGGVAHDFNNQLAGIMGYAELLALRLDDPQLRTYATSILTAAQRSADLTSKLLAFARKGQYRRVAVDAHAVLDETLALLQHSIDRRIAIVRDFAANPATVTGDPSQLANAFLNLCLNARDAMPQGGTLTVATARRHHSGDAELAAGDYLAITITDTGTGMSDHVRAHLFEPFFTTKPPGQGTGMGLAAVYGTIRNHGGSIAVDSAVGRGTAFTLLLPAGSATGTTSGVLAPGIPQPPRLRILVADDEELVRNLLTTQLEAEGHQVVAVADGRQAVAAYRTARPPFDLVILDMLMPVMDGRDATRELRQIDPGVRVLLATGFSRDGGTHEVTEAGVGGILEKPFRRAELLRAISALISPGGAPAPG